MRKLFLALLLLLPIAIAQYAYDTIPSYDDKSQYSKDQYDESQYDKGQYDKSAEKYVPPPETRVCVEGVTQCSKGEWLACRDNNWLVVQRCAANERCDDRAGCIMPPSIQTDTHLPPPDTSSLPEGVSRLSCGDWPRGYYYGRIELPSDIPFNESRGDCVLVGRNESIEFYFRIVEERIRRCREVNRADFERAQRSISNISAQIPRLMIPVSEYRLRMSEPCLAGWDRSLVTPWSFTPLNYSQWPGRELTRRLGAINGYAGAACNTGASISILAWEACHGIDGMLECGIISPVFAEFASNISRDIQLKYDFYENSFNAIEQEVAQFRMRYNPDMLRIRCEGVGQSIASRFASWFRGLFGF